MANGNCILMTANPKGNFENIIVSGTPKPGTCMEIVPSTLPVGGRFTFRARSGQDGAKGPIAVLMDDAQQGFLPTVAYVSGTHTRIYWPIPGDELNMLLKYQPGTGTSLNENIGDLLEVDGATGKLQGIGTTGPSTAHVSAPFQLREHLGIAVAADQLVWTQFLGGNA